MPDSYTIRDLAYSKSVPAPVRDALLAMQAELTAKEAEIEKLRSKLSERQRPQGETVEGVIKWLLEDPERADIARAALGGGHE